MDPFTVSLIAGGAGGLADAIFGKDPETMTPEERKLFNYV